MPAVDTASLPPSIPPAPSPAEGELFANRFELQSLLGRGGMGEVWEARDRVLGRTVALKIFAHSGLSERAAERIRREVTVARDLAHPNLVRYYDIHEDGGRLGLSMERVEGSTLQEALARNGPLPEARVRTALAALAEALDHLHARGIVHRDVKPSNIFLGTDGMVKLGDFGIVHLEDEGGLTRTGETLGTPTHMAPEQFRGDAPSPASDWYATGIVLYEMFSGRTPFTGTYGTIAAGHMDRPAPALPRASISSPARRLVEGLLLKEPRRRWNGTAVRKYCSGRRLPLLPRHRRFAATAIGALVLAAIGWAVGQRLVHPPPTAIRIQGESLQAYAADRLLWSRTEPGMTSALLADTDGDGDQEVAVGRWMEADPMLKTLQVDVLEGNGRPGAPLSLGGGLGNVFPAFHRRYETVLRDAGAGRIGVFVQHAQFYPTYGFMWDGAARAVVFTFSHSGRIYGVVPFHGGAAFEGTNNRLLHQRVLLVTAPLGGARVGVSIVDDVNEVALKGARAYYLLGDAEAVFLDGPDRVRVRLGPGEEQALLPNGDLEGLAGSASNSLAYLMEYRRIRDILLQGDAAEGRARLGTVLAEVKTSGLKGYAALFTALEAEGRAREGSWRQASLAAGDGATWLPGYNQDLIIQAALYALLAGDAAWGRDRLAGISSEWMGSRRDEVRTLVVWASMLQSPDAGRADFHAERPLLVSSPYWIPYMEFQLGWAALLDGDPRKAMEILSPALRAEGMEHHATGRFLAAIAAGSFDASTFDAYLDFAGTRPEYLLWVGAFGKGDVSEAARHWALLEQDAYHTPDSALMLALLNRVKAVCGL